MTDPNSGPGWYEWAKMPANATEIAHVGEGGEVYDPVNGWNPPEFTLASAEGRVHRLVRADDEDALLEALSDLNDGYDTQSSEWESTGGIVPPHITDKIAGHENDQP